MGRREERFASAVAVVIWVLGGSASLATSPRVLWVEGAVTARTLGEGKSRALELQPTDLLPNKARLVVKSGGALWFMDGKDAVGLHGPGVWELPTNKGGEGEGRTTRVSLATLGLDGEPLIPWIEIETPLEAHAALIPLSPVETGVTTRRPVLRWRALPAVRRVNLTLSRRDGDGTIHPVERWRGLTGTHHEVSRPLEPGHDYRWELRVEAQDIATPSGDAPEQSTGDRETAEHPGAEPEVRGLLPARTTTWFHVLSDDAIRAVRGADAAVSTYQLDTPDAASALEVVRALVWEHHGLAAEARVAWDEILAQTGDVEALRLYRARLALRALGSPRTLQRPAAPDTRSGQGTASPASKTPADEPGSVPQGP